MTLSGILFVCIMLCTANLYAQNTADYIAMADLKAELIFAIKDADREGIRKVINSLEAHTDNKELSQYAHYYLALSWYRLYNYSSDDSGGEKPQYLDRSISHAKEVLEINPDFIEANIILGNAYGVKAEKSLFAGIRFGNKAKNLFEEALKKEPENPRAAMFVAVGTLYKPAFLGGSADKAVEQLLKAELLFEKYRPVNRLYPNWGYSELYAWLGQAYEETGAIDDAIIAYQRALQIHPGFRWVRDKLLPAAQKKVDN